ncbi:MAG: beta-ketoacyl synthase N-terminal-like domain-containing protein [Elusimicrobiota bacterium]
MSNEVVITAYDLITAYGCGIEVCWQGLLSRQTAIRRCERFFTGNFQTNNAATIPLFDERKTSEDSLLIQILRMLIGEAGANIPKDSRLMFASTAGEIDVLEEAVIAKNSEVQDSYPGCLLAKVKDLCRLSGPALYVSAACASSTAAVAQAAMMIESGLTDCVLVAAGDIVSEFVFAGFSSLMALSPDVARPFDRNRNGLSIGEAAGYALLMSKERALREERNILGEVSGWGLTSDANHMTGPSRDGEGLAEAIRKALRKAGKPIEAVGSIAAHGTGTLYNDAMEMKAFQKVFGERKLPAYSVKGAIGHTLGAAGLVEMIIGLKSLAEGMVPPTVNLIDVDAEAEGMVSATALPMDSLTTVSVNAGFGGINAALVITKIL